MRWLLPLVIFLILVLLLEYYAFQAVKTTAKSSIVKWAWIIVNTGIYGYLLYILFFSSNAVGQTASTQMATGVFLTFFIPKIVIFTLLFGEDIVRVLTKLISLVSQGPSTPIAGRRKFLSQLALGLAAIPFTSFIYGIIKGRYNYKVLKYQLAFKDLPEAFDGFTLTQISDIHSGSFTNKEKIQYGVDMINEQKSDVILFTGDIVNYKASEMDPWLEVFRQLNAPMGIYSILGNHDYGEYIRGASKDEKAKELQAVKEIHPKIGFDLLCNEHRYIEKDGQRIALIGVENWGKKFKQAGDLKKASKGVDRKEFKILMSHDPSHWDIEVKENEFNYHLTLSGHTHGLQFGIEIPGFLKFSPVSFMYKYWAGLYKEFGRYINVNRGFGYHVYPGRVGIWPEITVIELKKA
ncbi:MAG: metallophosphoesterase [Flavobacteriales bacterium]|nr:metallophosphoesterase [Flavobacteriales bacterium]